MELTDFDPDQTWVDANGVVLILDLESACIYRWNSTTRAFLTPITLSSIANAASYRHLIEYHPQTNAIYQLQADGRLTRQILDGSNEETLDTLSIHSANAVHQMSDKLMVLYHHSSFEQVIRIVELDGTFVSEYRWNRSHFGHDELLYSDTDQRFYYHENGDLVSQELDTAGNFGEISSYGQVYAGPKRYAPLYKKPGGGPLLFASGTFWDPQTLQHTDSLYKPNSIHNATLNGVSWTGQYLFTLYKPGIAGATLDRWSESPYAVHNGSINLDGDAFSLHSYGDELIAITQEYGTPRIYLLDEDLNILAKTGSAPLAPGPGSVDLLHANQVQVSWSDLSDNENAFILEYAASTSHSATWTSVNLPANTTSHVFTNLDFTQFYRFRVRATNAIGESVSISLGEVTTDGDFAPYGLKLAYLGLDAITIEWTDLYDSESGYEVERVQYGYGWPGTIAATLPADSTSYSEPPQAGYGHWYRVRALGPVSNKYSSSLLILTPTQLPVAPYRGPIRIETATYVGSGIELSWFNDYRNHDGIRVQMKVGSNWDTLAELPSDATNYLDTIPAGTSRTYRVQVYNAAGFKSSSEYSVSVPDPLNYTGVSARHNNIVYFVYTDPLEIHRYNLKTESWLESRPIPLQTSFLHVDDSGVYTVQERRVVKLDHSLINTTDLPSTDRDFVNLFSSESHLYYHYEDYHSGTMVRALDKQTLLAPPDFEVSGTYVYPSAVEYPYVVAKNCFLMVTGQSIIPMFVQADNTLVAGPEAGKGNGSIEVFPDETRIVNLSGDIMNTNDFHVNQSLAVDADDVIHAEDWLVFAKDRFLRFYNHQGQLVAVYTLAHNSQKLEYYNGTLYSFYDDPNGHLGLLVEMVNLERMQLGSEQEPTDLYGVRTEPYSTFLGSDGVLYHYHRSQMRIFRWDPQSRLYLEPIVLQEAPFYYSYNPSLHRLYFGAWNGELTFIELDEHNPSPVYVDTVMPTSGNVTNPFYGLVELNAEGNAIHAFVHPSGASDEIYTYSLDGTFLGLTSASFKIRPGKWHPEDEKLYKLYDHDINRMSYTEPTTYGIREQSPFHYDPRLSHPLILSPANDYVIFGSGLVLHHSDLTQYLEIPRSFTDGCWHQDAFYGISELTAGQSTLSSWRKPDFTMQAEITFEGIPHTIHSLADGRLLVTTFVEGQLTHHLFDATLTDAASAVDVNHAPTDLLLSPGSLPDRDWLEQEVLGTLRAIDPDIGDIHTYRLMNSGHHYLFEIEGNQLRAIQTHQSSSLSTFNLSLEATDSYGGTVEKDFTLTKSSTAGNQRLLTFQNPPNPQGATPIHTYQENDASIRSTAHNYYHIAADQESQWPSNGSPYILAGQEGMLLEIETADGRPFAFRSFDLAELSQEAASVTITGTYAGGGNTVFNLQSDGATDGFGPIQDFQTFYLPSSFNGLSQVVISGGPLALDNIHLFADNAASNLPQVYLTSQDRILTEASEHVSPAEANMTNAFLEVVRVGSNTSSPLSVQLEFSGSAQKDLDYNVYGLSTGTTVEIPAGMSSTSLTLVALADNWVESAENVQVRILANAGYDADTLPFYLHLYDAPEDAYLEKMAPGWGLQSVRSERDVQAPFLGGPPLLIRYGSAQDQGGHLPLSGTYWDGSNWFFDYSWTQHRMMKKYEIQGEISGDLETWLPATPNQTNTTDDYESHQGRELLPSGDERFFRIRIAPSDL